GTSTAKSQGSRWSSWAQSRASLRTASPDRMHGASSSPGAQAGNWMRGASSSPAVGVGKGLRARFMCSPPAFAAGLAVPSLRSRGEGDPLCAILHTEHPANPDDLPDWSKSPGHEAPCAPQGPTRLEEVVWDIRAVVGGF